jgi:hypothetical protein
MFAFARAVAKLFTSWSNTAPMHVGGPPSLASILGADWQILTPQSPFDRPSPQSYRNHYRCPHRTKQGNEHEAPSRQRKSAGKSSDCREKKQFTDVSVISPQFHSRPPLPRRGLPDFSAEQLAGLLLSG